MLGLGTISDSSRIIFFKSSQVFPLCPEKFLELVKKIRLWALNSASISDTLVLERQAERVS